MSRKDRRAAKIAAAQATAADIAAQSQAAEEAEIQQAFEQGIYVTSFLLALSKSIPATSDLVPNMAALSTFMVILVVYILVGSLDLLTSMKFSMFLCMFIQSKLPSS